MEEIKAGVRNNGQGQEMEAGPLLGGGNKEEDCTEDVGDNWCHRQGVGEEHCSPANINKEN